MKKLLTTSMLALSLILTSTSAMAFYDIAAFEKSVEQARKDPKKQAETKAWVKQKLKESKQHQARIKAEQAKLAKKRAQQAQVNTQALPQANQGYVQQGYVQQPIAQQQAYVQQVQQVQQQPRPSIQQMRYAGHLFENSPQYKFNDPRLMDFDITKL